LGNFVIWGLLQAKKEDHEHTETCDIKKLFYLCINRAKPKLLDQVTPPPLPLTSPNFLSTPGQIKGAA